MSQLHIRAEPGAVAPIVLLPGDPDRATLIAEQFLEDAQPYTTYRRLYGYTGSYRGVPMSVQATGMGCPSLAIVTEELIRLGAGLLVRVGTSGTVGDRVSPGDLIVANASIANEGTSRQYLQGREFSASADFAVTQALAAAAGAMARPSHVGLIRTDDAFYGVSPAEVAELSELGVLGIEMEASALFLLGAMRGVRTGCMLAASNRIGDSSFVAESVLTEAINDMISATLDACWELHQSGESERSRA